MKLAYIILILIFGLTASYGLEKFFAGRREKLAAAMESAKRESKNVQVQSKRGDAKAAPLEPDCDVQALLSNDFFDLSRNIVQGRNENMPMESKLENLFQLLGVLEIGDCKAAVIVSRSQPQRGPAIKGKTADKRIYLLGDTLGNGYKLSNIEQKSVKFTKDGREYELAMFQDRKGTAQAGPGIIPGIQGIPPIPNNMARPPRNIRSR